MKRVLFVLATWFTLALPTAAVAGSNIATMQVAVTVDGTCNISTSPVVFPDYNPIGTNAASPDDGTGTITIQCSTGLVAHIGLDAGLAYAGTNRMHDALSEYIPYALYQDTGRTTPWGNTPSTWVGTTPAPSTSPQVFTVYGRIPAGQTSPGGSYADTVVATVNF